MRAGLGVFRVMGDPVRFLVWLHIRRAAVDRYGGSNGLHEELGWEAGNPFCK